MLSHIPNSVQVQMLEGKKDEKDKSKEFLPKKPKVSSKYFLTFLFL